MSAYDLKSVKLPRLEGASLRLLAAALDNPVTQKPIAAQLLNDGGITRLRRLQFDEPPTWNPTAFYGVGRSAQPASTPNLGTFELDELAGNASTPFHTVADYAAAYRSGQITPEDVARKVLESISDSDSSQPPLRAFIANDHDDVMKQAQASTRRIQAGEPLSIFDGVPVAIKDEIDQAPYPTTVGTTCLVGPPVETDGTVVARLRAAGALLIGKANMYEIGINPEGFNAHYGTARNPYNLAHDPGGSSSGPAAAVAAGFCPVSIGADGGGSIRIPAAHCGQVGLKATLGRISEFGAAPLCWSVAHVGPIGTTVADVAMAYAVIAGPDARDPNSQMQPELTLTGWNNPDLSGLRLGVYRPWFQHAHPEVVSAAEAMLDRLVQAGAQLREIQIPDLDLMRIAHVVTIYAEMAASLKNAQVKWRELSHTVRVSLAVARTLSAFDYLQAQRARTRAMAIFDQVFSEVDAVMTPATGLAAPVIAKGSAAGGWSDLSVVTEVMRYIVPGNLLGLPAISFPAGYDSQGLPVGMQAMGRPWEEHVLLRIAYAAEQVVERRRPALHYRILD